MYIHNLYVSEHQKKKIHGSKRMEHKTLFVVIHWLGKLIQIRLMQIKEPSKRKS